MNTLTVKARSFSILPLLICSTLAGPREWPLFLYLNGVFVMSESDEFRAFVEQCRKTGLPEIKALRARMAELPPGIDKGIFADEVMELLEMGAEYARLEERVKEEDDHGC